MNTVRHAIFPSISLPIFLSLHLFNAFPLSLFFFIYVLVPFFQPAFHSLSFSFLLSVCLSRIPFFQSASNSVSVCFFLSLSPPLHPSLKPLTTSSDITSQY